MDGAFLSLWVALEAVPQAAQQRRDRLVADPVALSRQRVRQLPGAAASPAKGAFRIAPRGRLDQCLQRRQQPRPLSGQFFAATTRFPNSTRKAGA